LKKWEQRSAVRDTSRKLLQSFEMIRYRFDDQMGSRHDLSIPVHGSDYQDVHLDEGTGTVWVFFHRNSRGLDSVSRLEYA
jgi:hypothetical protein